MISQRRFRMRGHAALELALLSPWIYFLGAGALDVGFYTNAMISTQNAARVAAEYSSKFPNAPTATLCRYALDELSGMPNARALTGCTALPVVLTKETVTDFDSVQASKISVTYQTQKLIPIPGLPGQLTVTRTVQMRNL